MKTNNAKYYSKDDYKCNKIKGESKVFSFEA